MMAAEIKNIKAFYNTEIPSDWEVYRLEKVCSHFKSGFGITSEQINESGDYPVYGGNGLRGYTNSFTHDGEYLLIGRQGALCGNIQRVSNKVYISEHAIAVQPNNENDIDFLAYKLEHKNLNRHSESSAQPGLSVEKLVRLKIEVPTLPEQKAIAQVLSTADSAIHTTEKLIAQKELRKKWLMQQLLTGKKRLKGFDGEWKEKKLGDFIIESRIPSINNDVNRRITVKLNLKGIEKRDVRGSEAEDATYYFIRKKSQFIYGKQNLHKGAFGIIPDELDGFESSQDIPTFDFQDGVSPSYFMFFMSQESFYQSLEKISTGTGSKRIHPENLFKVKVKFPALGEQTAIAQVLQAADKEISLLRAKAEKLKEQKKGLMQVLLTGKVRLKI
jgi:type I restriction enzyme S subunit